MVTMDIQPTITAHPTEARRRSVLTKQHEISTMIADVGSNSHTEDEKRHLKREIFNQMKLLLMTDEVRAERMSVEDEVENGLFFFTHTIWDVVPSYIVIFGSRWKPTTENPVISRLY